MTQKLKERYAVLKYNTKLSCKFLLSKLFEVEAYITLRMSHLTVIMTRKRKINRHEAIETCSFDAFCKLTLKIT